MGSFRFAIVLVPFALGAQTGGRAMTIEEYEPRSTLKVPQHLVPRAKYPFVDVHGHQSLQLATDQLDRLVGEMDAMNMRVMVNLSGRQGDVLAAGVRNYSRHKNRIVVFANLDFRGIENPAWGANAAAQLARDAQAGAVGLKIFKNLGMDVFDAAGKRVAVDDPRLDAVWSKAGELNIPVLIHTGEPSEFFQPMDNRNERWLELATHPGRARPPDRFPSFEQLMTEQHNMFRKHPKTRFINAHLGWLGSDLARLGALMDSLPNMYTELGAVLYELGRQPKFARDFLTKYQDRVMMGKDSYDAEEYPVYFRVFETGDEYFDYYRKYHAFWKMYGLQLPDSILRKIYYENALRVIPGIDKSLFANVAAGR